MDSAILSRFGEKVLSVAAESPDLRDLAWSAAKESWTQRTFINSDFVPPLPIPQAVQGPARFTFPDRDHPGRTTWRGAWVAPDHGAILERLEEHLNSKATSVPEYLLAENARFSLDRFRARNVVFKDCHIVYKGGPIQLHHVYFVHCIFEIDQDGNGERFGKALLASARVTFTAS
jgi:hypothetical protein